MNILQDRLPQKLKRGGSLANYGSNVQIDVAEDFSISDKKGRSLGRDEEDFVADKDKQSSGVGGGGLNHSLEQEKRSDCSKSGAE